mgnify:FL=1|jgi:hypothetical protein
MAKNIFLLLGNGFSIDLMNQLKMSDKINLSNLFAAGSDVSWPATDIPGFLSFQNCPNLWTLGARPYLRGEDSLRIIEDVITCANILPQRTEIKDKIYIRAYNELEQYLMSLFVHYTGKVKLRKDKINNWGWVKFLRSLASNKDVKTVNIVSFNYDVWLELILELYGIPFSIAGLSEKKEKFQIFKPHGSIAFHSAKRDKEAYSIQYRDSFDNHPLKDFKYDNKNLDCLNLVNAIIPPAGDSTRLSQMWSSELRNQIKMAATSLGKDDSVVICGLSYWHVDRKEIDTYLSAISPEIENLIMVNPNPPEVLNAVLMTLFNQYIVIPDSKNLIKYEKI